jgi:flagellar protein FliS
MSYGAARARYADETAQTVSPARLLTMLYDRLVQDLLAAEQAMEQDDVATTGERLGRAQEILLELRASLDTSVWTEGEALGALYLWMIGELMQARLRKSLERVRTCRELLEPLRDAWRAAAVETATAEAAAVAAASVEPGMAVAGAHADGKA